MFSIPDYLTLRLGEEAAEVAQRTGKSLAYGHDEVNVKEPTGPNNTDKLVGELNDLLAVADMLVEAGVLPVFWQDEEAQAQKKSKVVTFMAHSYNQDRIEPGEEEALEELCQRYLGTDISTVCDGIASGAEEWKRERTPVVVKPSAPPLPPINDKHLMRSPATVTQVFDPPLRPIKPFVQPRIKPPRSTREQRRSSQALAGAVDDDLPRAHRWGQVAVALDLRAIQGSRGGRTPWRCR